ncbi:hypothetical protein MAR_028883 [Mya arenaria]|uniref:Fibronectin type-III domain-containing protein n=1 Tax=Mya arenaria TaxID=6604 RepID=A0ABY7DJC7_MYAAR|nr:hypothetical protein MAR_028883 [Mya arenaria]
MEKDEIEEGDITVSPDQEVEMSTDEAAQSECGEIEEKEDGDRPLEKQHSEAVGKEPRLPIAFEDIDEVDDPEFCEDLNIPKMVNIESNKGPPGVLVKSSEFLKYCEPCKSLENVDKAAEVFCKECEELMCKTCKERHSASKRLRDHEFTEVPKIKDVEKPQLYCEPCQHQGQQRDAVCFCPECENELLCENCRKVHKVMKTTRMHKIFDVSDVIPVISPTPTSVRCCEPCEAQNVHSIATMLCPVCGDEALCDACARYHKAQKITKEHILYPVQGLTQKSTKKMPQKLFCDPCKAQDMEYEASMFCRECDDELLCDHCVKYHGAHKKTRHHALFPMSENSNQGKKESMKRLSEPGFPSVRPKHALDRSFETDTHQKEQPGKPIAADISSDSLTLFWNKPERFGPNDYFQISYKELNREGKWRVYHGEYTASTVKLENLKSNARFVFRVRVISIDEEWPYSPLSDEIQTETSPASRIVEFSVLLTDEEHRNDNNWSPDVYALPLTEVKEARNALAKTRKFEVGARPKGLVKEKYIMMIGETGTGKSTLVDGIANYVMGVNWQDPFRFSIVNLEDEEKKKKTNQALSQTEWITCYTIYPAKGSRLQYTIHIIDTPGFGDTRGIDRDQEIVQQIKELFSEKEPKGVLSIDAVCFLIKAPDARLTPIQSYIFQQIMSLFGKDIEENICSLVTFADGLDPPVFAALKESGLPFGKRFTFNNSGLFAKNKDIECTCLSPMFWDMGMKSFSNFFHYIDDLPTKSLQLTTDVLNERCRLEMTVVNLQPKIDVGLHKIHQLKGEIRFFEENKAIIADNKDFTYFTTSTHQVKKDLPRGQHVTNCTHCHFTCHQNCGIPNNEDKRGCWAMNRSTGFCRICPDNCYWDKHSNTPYIFEYVLVDEVKTYAEMKQKYEDASGKLLTQEQVLEKMGEELGEMIDTIEDMMVTIRNCNVRLGTIALRPNPLTVTEHIDLMIQNEKMQKKNGWYQRVKTLYRFKKRAEVAKDVEAFQTEANTLGVVGRRKKDRRTVFQRFRDLFGW